MIKRGSQRKPESGQRSSMVSSHFPALIFLSDGLCLGIASQINHFFQKKLLAIVFVTVTAWSQKNINSSLKILLNQSVNPSGPQLLLCFVKWINSDCNRKFVNFFCFYLTWDLVLCICQGLMKTGHFQWYPVASVNIYPTGCC